jgi:cell division transport system permease protein
MKRKLITLSRIVRTGILNFFRNASLAIAAMAVMVVTLSIILFSIVGNATFSHTIEDITSKVDVSVFLKDEVTSEQTQDLIAKIKKRPDVKEVEYLNKAQAQKSFAEQVAENPKIVASTAEADNPIPATLHIKPYDLNQAQEITNFLNRPENKKLQGKDSPSYNGKKKEAIDNISRSASAMQRMGVAAVLLFAVVSVLIIFNTIQMAIFNRRDEISIMRLLGASTWFIRGPFIVESIIYGLASGVISIVLINSAFFASSATLKASSLGILDVSFAQKFFQQHFFQFLTLQLGAGIIIGAASSFIATRRYLKFKSK